MVTISTFQIQWRTSFIIISIALLLLGCQSTGKKPQEVPDFRSGTSGLEMAFLKNAPPKQAFEQSSFPVLVRVKNQGTFSIPQTQGMLSLGVERDYTKSVLVEQGGRVSSENDNEALFYLPGKSLINTKGEEEIISFTVTPSKIDPQSETHKSLLTATLCYPYRTDLLTSVCVDPDPYSIKPGKKPCTAQDLTFASGQGAPVAITKVEVQMLPQEEGRSLTSQFLIYMENKGKGEVIRPGAHQNICRGSSRSMALKDFNVLNIDAKLSGKKMKCSLRTDAASPESSSSSENPGYVKLTSKKDVVRCIYGPQIDSPETALISPKESFTTSLQITLDYGYTQSLSSEYVIKKGDPGR